MCKNEVLNLVVRHVLNAARQLVVQPQLLFLLRKPQTDRVMEPFLIKAGGELGVCMQDLVLFDL